MDVVLIFQLKRKKSVRRNWRNLWDERTWLDARFCWHITKTFQTHVIKISRQHALKSYSNFKVDEINGLHTLVCRLTEIRTVQQSMTKNQTFTKLVSGRLLLDVRDHIHPNMVSDIRLRESYRLLHSQLMFWTSASIFCNTDVCSPPRHSRSETNWVNYLSGVETTCLAHSRYDKRT